MLTYAIILTSNVPL